MLQLSNLSCFQKQTVRLLFDKIHYEIKIKVPVNNSKGPLQVRSKNNCSPLFNCPGRRDAQLPHGWRYYDNGRGATFFRDGSGTRFSSRRKVLAHMVKVIKVLFTLTAMQ